MTTKWDKLYASDANFKEFVLAVVEEEKVASISIGDKRALLSQYEQQQQNDSSFSTDMDVNIAFDEWKGMPNGSGVYGCTALPERALVDQLEREAPGVYWLESPASSGKTALGQILSIRGWQYINLQESRGSVPIKIDNATKKVFIDEAQKLRLKDIDYIRGVGATAGFCIVCAGISGVPVPTCPTCKKSSCKVCSKCWKYECQFSGTECCAERHLVPTISMVIAEAESQRFSVDDLACSTEELAKFLELFFCGERDLCGHIPLDAAPLLAREIAPLLRDLTGGLMSFIVSILRTLFYSVKHWKNAPQIDIGHAEQHAKAILAATNRPEVIAALRTSRLMVVLEGDEQESLVRFVRDRRDPVEPQRSSLRKKALLRFSVETNHCEPWSPLVFDILTYKLFQEHGHIACSFDESTVDGLVKYLVAQLSLDEYKTRVYDVSLQALKHEDEINSAISSVIKPALGAAGLHRGPAKQCDEGKYKYSQVDHAIYWANVRTPTLIETCLSGLKSHVDRFDSRKGAYPEAYDFGVGIILFVSVAKMPRTLPIVPANCFVFHISIPTFTMLKFDSTSKSWHDYPPSGNPS